MAIPYNGRSKETGSAHNIKKGDSNLLPFLQTQEDTFRDIRQDHEDTLLQRAPMYNVNEMSDDDDLLMDDDDESLEKANLDL